METTAKAASSSTLHPVLWVAAIAVTLLSLAGIAALSGILPLRQAPEAPPPVAVTAPPVLPPPAAAIAPPAAPVATPPAATAQPLPASRNKVVKKQVETNREPPLAAVSLPPPLASGMPPDYAPPAVMAAPPLCVDCGVIADVRQVTREGQGTGAGAIVGGLAGGALANNIGRGDGRTLATILGAVGGGLLGNSVEKSQRKTVAYEVTVRLDDGASRQIESDTLPAWRIGDKVKLVGGAIVAR